MIEGKCIVSVSKGVGGGRTDSTLAGGGGLRCHVIVFLRDLHGTIDQN